MTDTQYFSPDRLISADAVREAVHTLFTQEYASVAEGLGMRLPCRGEMTLEEWAPRQADAIMLPFAWWLIGRVQQAWGQSVGLVFHHAGIKSEADQTDALTLLFLGLSGSGANLQEEPIFAEGLEKAGEVFKTTFNHAPFYHEMSELWELAQKMLTEKYGEANESDVDTES